MKFQERLAEADVNQNFGPLFTSWLVILIVASYALKIVCFPVQYASKAAAVVAHEIDPALLQQKYEWFKNAHAALDAKVATIATYQARTVKLQKLYGTDAVKWPRDVREEWSLEASEEAGVIASYNTLAADYNAQMAKWNWRFTNISGLPQGATEPLPREYAPYKEGN
jgi:hypothetical protein